MTPVDDACAGRGNPTSPLIFPALISPALATALLMTLGAAAELPLPTYPQCASGRSDETCPSDLDGAWDLVSYVGEDYVSVRPEELEIGSGIAADVAWAYTTGHTEVLIAVLDCGIKWDNDDTVRKHHLNRGELLEPQDADGVAVAGRWDLDGSGVFNIDDYAVDPRVDITDGVDVADHMLDPSDLIHNPAFADGVDSDGNGYIDDISGWDFHWNDNDPYDDTRYDHGTFEATTSCAEGNDGGDIGVCPNCMLLNVRTGDAFVMDGDNYASGVAFAVDSGAHVVQAASGALGHSAYAQQVMQYAVDQGVALVCAAADETSFHHNLPSTDPRALSVKAVRYDEDDREDVTTFLNFSNCTNYGPRVDLSASSTNCASGGTAMVAGAVGLVVSAAVDSGLDPALSPGEIKQILVGTSVDIDVAESRSDDADPDKYPSYPGYDLYFSHGRIHAGRAVQAVFERRIPPEVRIDEPPWFEPLLAQRTTTIEITGALASRTGGLFVTVSWAPGGDPRDDSFVELASFIVDGTSWSGTFGTLDAADVLAAERVAPRPLTEQDDNVDRSLMAHGWMANIRVTVRDADGNTAVERRTISLIEDHDLRQGFPLQLGASVEGSPKLVDLDHDGLPEILIGTADGLLHAVDADGNELDGWPAAVERLEEVEPGGVGNHLSAEAFLSGAVSRQAFGALLTTPAADDLDGDGSVEIVVTSLRGWVHVLTAGGAERDGFPVSVDPLLSDPATTSSARVVDRGFGSSASLGDLDGDGDLEIVAGGMDGFIYAWHDDGTLVDGWPVALNYDGPDQWPVARIVGTPALGDIDGDGLIDVVVGSNESIGGTYGLAYAVHGAGNTSPDGAYLTGWPVTLFGAFTAALPVVGEGTTASPALADLDGDGVLEVVLPTIADLGVVLRGDGTTYVELGAIEDWFGGLSNARSGSFLHGVSSPAIADVDGDGVLDVINSGIDPEFGVGIVDDGRRREFDHLLGAWNTIDGRFLRGFPRQMEDIQFFMNPAVADLDGDDMPEIIAGSGGFFLHAFDHRGDEPAGWPKTTGGWITSSPAVNDLDGDGQIEVVAATRAGYLFAWDTVGPVDGNVQWASFHHDQRNSGNVTVPLNMPGARVAVYNRTAAGCHCTGEGSSSPFEDPAGGAPAASVVVLGMLWLRVRRLPGRGPRC